MREQSRIARDPSFLLLNIGFFTCGFHVAFLVTHFPGEIQNCGLMPSVAANSLAIIGLFNVAGSVGAGMLGQRFRMKYLLALIYAARAVMIAVYLVMPKTALNIYVFAAGMGMTWLATVPPTSGIVRQALWRALSRHAVWPDAGVSPDRRVSRCVARGRRDGADAFVSVDVVCGYGVGARRGGCEFADQKRSPIQRRAVAAEGRIKSPSRGMKGGKPALREPSSK